MTDQEWSDEDVRVAAEELAERLATDPGSVTPSAAGAVGHARVFGLDLGAEDLTAQLDVPIALLRHGIVFAPDDERLGAWMLSLASALGLREEWDEAAYWGGQAAAFPYTDAEEEAETLLEVGDILLERAKAVPGRLADLPDVLAGLAERSTLPEVTAAIRARQARALALRWNADGVDDDLRDALDLLVDNLPLIPADFPFRTDDLVLFAEVCRRGHLLDRTAPLDDAIKAIETVIAEEDLPEHHEQLALLLDLRHPDDRGPARDRIIDSLAHVVEHDPDVGQWYADLLYDRGRDNDDADDLRTAIQWFTRRADQPDPDEPDEPDPWITWAVLTEAHDELRRLTGEPEQADRVVDCASRALAFAVPDQEIEHDLMRYRLAAAFLDGKRPDLPQFIARHPVRQWLATAQDSVDEASAAGPPTESAAMLAANVGFGWAYLTMHASEQVITEAAHVPILMTDILRMLNGADRLPDLPAELRTLLRAVIELFTNLSRAADGDGEATFTAIKAALDDPALAEHRADLIGMVGVISGLTGNHVQGLGPFDMADPILGDEEGRLDRTPEEQREMEALQAYFRMMRSFHVNADHREIRESAATAWRLLSALPDTPHMAAIVELGRMMYRLVESQYSGVLPGPGRTGVYLEHLMTPLQMGSEIAAAVRRRDPAAIRDVLDRLDRLPAESHSPLRGTNPVEHVRVVAWDALSTLEPGNREALERAIAGNVERWERRSGFDPLFETWAMPFARLLRRRDADGDRAFSRLVGREALRATTWKVLVQSGSEHALEMARHATTMVDELTAWCERDGALDDLLAAVDARRALVLKAANTGRTVADQLRAIGRGDLAEQWTSADGRDEAVLPDWQEPDDDWGALRRTVLRELAEHGDELVDQPSVEEIQDALRAHGSGCLVYLLPANDHHGGMALLVPAHGRPRVRPLPDLRVDTAVERYRVAYEAREETRDDESVARWRAELGELCSWAWGAAGGELSRIGGQHGRLVLVPVGSLGLVPWHATRRAIDGADRYLVQDVPVSYAPSARLFCDLVRRAEVGPGRAVLVGNPARDLPTGAYEAKAIRDVFYPGGAFLGGFGQGRVRWRPAEDGTGTAEQVLAGLRSPLPVLHLACHAVADMRRPLQSEVRLATGPLSARQLLDHSRTALLPLGLVNLAGCRTNVSGIDYDEALSLSTTFLAIGARTVIGSLWRVPSGRTTAHLMFLFYHHLLAERRPPADALRAAQLWMLDPGRSYPDSMPADIRALAPSAGFDYADVECWAGFTQQGR